MRARAPHLRLLGTLQCVRCASRGKSHRPLPTDPALVFCDECLLGGGKALSDIRGGDLGNALLGMVFDGDD